MNIFYLDDNPILCAQYHNNKHVNKMLIESVQLLSNALNFYGHPSPYKLTHKNHPCSVWTRSSLDNYTWLWRLANNLGKEFEYRYGKVHACYRKLWEFIPYVPNIDFPKIGFDNPPNCTPYKNIKNIVEAYRTYYIKDKAYFCKWTKRDIPWWYA